jgi:hypothetical protein
VYVALWETELEPPMSPDMPTVSLKGTALHIHATAIAALREAFEPAVPAAGTESVTDRRVQRS